MKVAFSKLADIDIEQISDYIAVDSPRRAMSFARELVESAHRIADTPLGFPLIPRYEDSGIHRRVHGNYSIFYRIERDGIGIVRILHGARDYEAVLVPED